jgi:hypothetical protein
MPKAISKKPPVSARKAATSSKAKPRSTKAQVTGSPADLDDDALLELVQRQTFRFFWEGAHPVSGLAPDRRTTRDEPVDDLVAIGGSGFGVMAIIVAVERGWVSREEALARLSGMLDMLLWRATCYHGALPHFMDGRTGATLRFGRKDDGGDIVETSFLVMGFLCARQYFTRDTQAEKSLRARIDVLWHEVEWDWYTQGGRRLLYWHWSPNNGWAMDHEIRGWNECLITYVLAVSSPRYPINPLAYHRGWAGGRDFLNGKTYYGTELPLGPDLGGPLFFSHYSFLGLDPHGLKDRYADYWTQNVAQVRIDHAYCVANPKGFKGYGDACWGLTASDDPGGYDAHAPNNDNGTISPTAALSSFPYAPEECMRALRHFFSVHGERIWARYGFVDAFNESRDWYADSFLAIDQGPIVIMIENYRTGLLWKLFMSVPEVQAGLRRLDFTSPYLDPAVA